MQVKIYRSVSKWPRDLVLKVVYTEEIIENLIYFLAKKQNFSTKNIKDFSIEMSIKYVDDIEIKKLNSKYRNQNKPTNVLSFPSIELGKKLLNLKPNVTKKQVYLGDIVFAYQTILKEAEEQGKTVNNHIIHLLVHSVLHLFGFDHIDTQDQVEMEKIEIDFLTSLNINDVYD